MLITRQSSFKNIKMELKDKLQGNFSFPLLYRHEFLFCARFYNKLYHKLIFFTELNKTRLQQTVPEI
jgi:hypothetical protein